LTNPDAAGPNAEQVRYWNEIAGPRWVTQEEFLDSQISELGVATMDRAAVRPGEAVLDVGCGCGQTSLQLAERVGAQGSVLGIDVSEPMLERARLRSRAANLRFQLADAQTAGFPERFDLAFSRFGVMFFSDPPAAFRNLRRSLADEGRLAFVCWQGLDRNPWMREPLVAVAAHVPLPPPPAPGAPGPFAFADSARVKGILDAAGFSDVAFEPLERTLRIGGDGGLDAAVQFLLQLGPAGAALREAGEDASLRAAKAVREALAPHVTEQGVRMDSAAWIVTARV
jgi:SAM-dependent methyltransferase